MPEQQKGEEEPIRLQEWNFSLLNTPELDLLNSTFDFKTLGNETGKTLRQLLSSISVGKVLLGKAEKGEKLNSRDRALLVKIIVEAEISALDEHRKCIRKDVWQQWAREVSNVYLDESPEVYYMPYQVVSGKVIQASGLFHNRLITHRRYMNSFDKKRNSYSSDSGSDSSASSSQS